MIKTLKVKYAEWPPWAQDVRVGNETILTGVMKDIFDALSDSLNYKLELGSQKDHQFGSLLADGSFSGMLGALQKKEVDLVGPLKASEQRAAVADFTHCLESSKLGIITGIKSLDKNMFLYIHVFSWQVWLTLLFATIVTTFVAALIYNVSFKGWRSNQIYLLSRYSWMFWINLIGQNVGSTTHWTLTCIWNLQSFRILLASWLLGPVIITLFLFQCRITSTFTVTKLTSVVSNLEELTMKTSVIPVTTKGSSTEICFKNSKDHPQIWSRMQNHTIVFSENSVRDTLVKVEKGAHVLIVDYIYALGIATEWVKRNGRCSVQVEELLFCQNFIALALRKDTHPKRMREINSQLTYIMQAKLQDRSMNLVYSNYTHCTKHPSGGIRPLGIADILGGFVFWCIGIFVSFFVLLLEMSRTIYLKSQ